MFFVKNYFEKCQKYKKIGQPEKIKTLDENKNLYCIMALVIIMENANNIISFYPEIV
jgi:hypothetical protein